MRAIFLLSIFWAQLVLGCTSVTGVPAVDSKELSQSQALTIIPEQIDCGSISQCEMPPPIAIVIRNGTAEPVRIRGFVATCGCTIPDLQPNVEIAPGAEITVKVRLELWGQGRKQQFIRFIDENSQPLGRVQVRYEVRSPLRSTPSGISRDVNPDGSFQIESSDNGSFKIMESDPPVANSPSTESAADHTMTIDWAKVDALAVATPPISAFAFDSAGVWSTLLVRVSTDKADCSEVFVWLRNFTPARPVTH